jgi:general nucleoside transport system ATP-binding protein
VAILLLSADLAEVWDLADRVMVMTRGKLRGPVPVADTSLAEIGHWMTTP